MPNPEPKTDLLGQFTRSLIIILFPSPLKCIFYLKSGRFNFLTLLEEITLSNMGLLITCYLFQPTRTEELIYYYSVLIDFDFTL